MEIVDCRERKCHLQNKTLRASAFFYKTNENNFEVELFCIIGSLQNETFRHKM